MENIWKIYDTLWVFIAEYIENHRNMRKQKQCVHQTHGPIEGEPPETATCKSIQQISTHIQFSPTNPRSV